ncbi:pyridoxal phosphate-dependent decarboxylase family protein [Laspinema olomoucense]|uniref:pyridoxal phosphate-dependent decarboxylase family protein n=1 Tax=Laspinema olomoucense TaxID=3231600 RepID=UPI0021BB18BC|nr:aspartate aminotransferase family protein [Laspinema sp. D3d]MCT7972759.1 aspartate aminotransferase family protein [Laspinema sp. D3d]
MLEVEQKGAIASEDRRWDSCFLTDSEGSIEAYRQAIADAAAEVIRQFACQKQPYSGATPIELVAGLAGTEICPENPKLLGEILKNVGEKAIAHSVVVTHPCCIAHLHCPPLIPALAAEVLISATNQSMDSWDQSPAATVLEQQLTNWLCSEFGYDAAADGIFTSGGTQSNFMGMLLARDRYAKQALNWSIQQQGLPPQAHQWRILCSDVAHFTIRQSCALLGLGEKAVIPVETDENYRLSPDAVRVKLAELQEQGLTAIAIVATVGTTDFGSIDPLLPLAEIAQENGLWFHVDAAYGGALVMSDRYRPQLAGIDLADSITVDFHKLFYQPISCGAFLLKNKSNFDLMKLHADYLNPETNEAEGIPDLVTKSIQTTRRFDALKLCISLQALGRKKFGEMIESTIELAAAAGEMIRADSQLELATIPTLNAVVFRYSSGKLEQDKWINSQIRLTLLQRGEVVLAQTCIAGNTYLKFTLLNPRTTLADIGRILDRVKQVGTEFSLSLSN